MRRADAVELGHGQLALVGAAAAEDDVALAKAQLGADNVAALPPAANVQVAGIKVVKSDIDLFRRISRLDTVVHAFRERAERKPLPTLAIEQRQLPRFRLFPQAFQ